MCCRCGANKELLRGGYLSDPFKWHANILTISDFPEAIFDQFPLTARRYDWMHGITNMLHNCCLGLLALLPSSSLQRQQVRRARIRPQIKPENRHRG